MTAKTFWTAAAVAALLTCGCRGSVDDQCAQAVPPKTFPFEGKVEPKYVGAWKSVDGLSTVDLSKDGGLKIDTVTHSLLGKSVVHVSGQWRVDAGSLMFQYESKPQGPIVLKYSAAVSGKVLTLVLAGTRLRTVYHRK